MSDYTLALEAEQDLLEIGRYTTRTWDLEQALRYLELLEQHFAALAARDAHERAAFEHRADYRMSRCQHHFVFFLRNPDDHVFVLAVLHESMDLLARLRERLEGE